jgi:hypothetical protein
LHVQSFFAERFFHIFDKDKTEHISRRELKDGLLLLTSGSEVDKLRFLFQIYDIDGRYTNGREEILNWGGGGHIYIHIMLLLAIGFMPEA